MEQIRLKIENKKFKEEIVNKARYLVTEAVLLKEGVHNGLFYSKEILEKSYKDWDKITVTEEHPEEFIENNKDNKDKYSIGYLDNSKYEDGKLISNVYIKSSKVKDDVKIRIIEGDSVGVSTGLLAEIENSEGDYNGEKFKRSVVSMQADHLAILPKNDGACNNDDGCGIQIEGDKKVDVLYLKNQKKSKKLKENDTIVVENSKIMEKQEEKTEKTENITHEKENTGNSSTMKKCTNCSNKKEIMKYTFNEKEDLVDENGKVKLKSDFIAMTNRLEEKHKSRKEDLMVTILNSDSDIEYKREDLEPMKIKTLEKIANTVSFSKSHKELCENAKLEKEEVYRLSEDTVKKINSNFKRKNFGVKQEVNVINNAEELDVEDIVMGT